MISLSVRFFLLILFLSIAPLNGSSEEDIDNSIKRGLENCYHFNWKNAEKDFEHIIKNYPDDPRGYHYKSGIYLWYYLSSGNESELDTFLEYSNIAIEKAEAFLTKDPENEKINYTIGNAYSYRTLGYAKSESYLNAIFASKKSETYLKKIIELNPSYYDAYLGLGLYNFAAAQIPSAFRWALDLAGISGDEDTGIKYIKISAGKGSLSRVEAKYYLSQLLTGVLIDYKEAENILTPLHKKYPANILFSYSLAVVNMKLKNPGTAEKLLKNIISQDYPRFKQVISFSNFLLGDIYFRDNNPESAISYYKKFLNTAAENNFTGIASLRLGICYELLNKRDQAVTYYRKSSKGNSDIEDDVYASRRGEILLKRKLSNNEISLILTSNKIESGKFQEAYTELNQQLNNSLNSAFRAEILYYLSESAYNLGKTEESLNYALKGAELETGEEGWINALCFHNAARACKVLGREKEMMNYISKSEDNNDWDYQNQIENMLKSIKRQ